jgi:hypothetical protein
LCFGQFNPIFFATPYHKPNTFIGGVSATINTPALVASKLGISVSRIRSFSIVGSDIKFAVMGKYNLPLSSFEGNTSITYFRDEGALLNIGNNSFKGSTVVSVYSSGVINQTGTSIFQDMGSCTLLDLPNCISVPVSFFGNWYPWIVKTVNIPKATSIGLSQANDSIFSTIGAATLTLNVSIINQTSNSGGVEGDVAFAIANGATVNYIP